MPLLCYGIGVIRWTQAELQGLDTKTRNLIAKAKFHHKRSDVHILYLSIQYVGRGIVGVVDNHQQVYKKIAQYVEGYEHPLVQILKVDEGKQVHGLM